MKKVKITSPSAELAVIKAMCSRDIKVSGRVLATVDDSYFYETVSQELYETIKARFAESANVPTLRQILSDPEISDEAKEFIKTGESVEAPSTVDQADAALKLLNKYRRTRILYHMVRDVASAFEATKLDIDSLVLACAQQLQQAQSTKSTTDCFTHFGKGDNAKELLHDIVFGEDKGDIIPTGFTSFDSQSGGFNRGALVTLGATSGSGKSLLAAQLSVNLAEAGYKVVLVPLEMSKKEMGNRLLANIGNMDLSLIRQHKLDERDKNLLAKRHRRWRKKVYEAGGRLTIFRPEEDLDIDEVYAAIAALKCDVCIIDYISLLKGIDDENQWLRLGTIARKAKINAEITNRVNILLCQVNEDGKIRYSGAVKEHCVHGSSLLDTDHGFIRIDSLYPNAMVSSTKCVSGIKVKSDGGYKNITHVHYNGVRTVFRITLENGMSLTCTAKHKFRNLDKNTLAVDWVDAGHLFVGDYVAVNNTKSHFGKDFSIDLYAANYHTVKNPLATYKLRVNKNLGYLLGAICGDGYTGKYGYQFIATDKNILDKYTKCWYNTFKQNGVIREYITPKGVTCYRHFSGSQPVNHVLKSVVGLQGHARGKYIPELILRAGKNTVKEAIAGIFDSDGCVTADGANITLCSYSKRQMQVVQLLLNGFGINARYKDVTMRISGFNAYRFGQTFTLTEAKQGRLKQYTPKFDTDYIPQAAIDYLQRVSHRASFRLKKETQDLHDDLLRVGVLSEKDKVKNISYLTLTALMRKLKSPMLKNALRGIYENRDYRFVRITSIEKLGEEPVYDITVEDTHCYMVNGILTHNSETSWIWTPSDEDKKAGIVRIDQIKSRNAEPFPFSLKFVWNRMRVESVDEDIDSSNGLPDVTDDDQVNLAADI